MPSSRDVHHPLTAIRWANSNQVQVVDPVWAIGNPLGIGMSVSAGIVSALNRDLSETPYDDFIQTDAAINHGNSGGPLFNLQGEIIGVDTAMYSPKTGSVGLDFAIPSNDAHFIADHFIQNPNARPAYIGVKSDRVIADIAEALGISRPLGSIVAQVDAGSPAALAGLRVGDIVIRYDNETPSMSVRFNVISSSLISHIAVAPPALYEIIGVLRAGDIVTHCFACLSIRLFDDAGRLLDVARRAIDAGVILDIGHGAGSFTSAPAEAGLAAGIQPHAISTDIHQVSVAGPMFDLPTCLSKFLALGLGISKIIAMASSGPARILGFTDRGTLAPGAQAGIALFRVHTGEFSLYDNTGAVRVGRQSLCNVATIVGGRLLQRTAPPLRAVWAEKWDRGGTNLSIRAFQDQMRQLGRTPDLMCGCPSAEGLGAG